MACRSIYWIFKDIHFFASYSTNTYIYLSDTLYPIPVLGINQTELIRMQVETSLTGLPSICHMYTNQMVEEAEEEIQIIRDNPEG